MTNSMTQRRQVCASCLRTTSSYTTLTLNEGRRFHYCYEPACQLYGYTAAAQQRILDLAAGAR